MIISKVRSRNSRLMPRVHRAKIENRYCTAYYTKRVFTGTNYVHTRLRVRDEINKDKMRATAEKVLLEAAIMYSCTARFNERLRFV